MATVPSVCTWLLTSGTGLCWLYNIKPLTATEFEQGSKENTIISVCRLCATLFSVETLIGTSPVAASSCVLLQRALWPGRWLPVTHQPSAHYLIRVTVGSRSSNSPWNNRPQLIAQMLGGIVGQRRREGWVSVRSFCQWAQRNYIFYLGVIGEPLQMLSPAHLFVQLATGGAKGHSKCVVWMLRSTVQQFTL